MARVSEGFGERWGFKYRQREDSEESAARDGGFRSALSRMGDPARAGIRHGTIKKKKFGLHLSREDFFIFSIQSILAQLSKHSGSTKEKILVRIIIPRVDRLIKNQYII